MPIFIGFSIGRSQTGLEITRDGLGFHLHNAGDRGLLIELFWNPRMWSVRLNRGRTWSLGPVSFILNL